MPAGKIIHAILDNYATHKHPAVLKWLADHPRWTFHFTPTSASWLNAVEGFFSTITRRKIRRGVFPIRSRTRSRNRPLHQGAQQNRKALRLDEATQAIFDKLADLPEPSV